MKMMSLKRTMTGVFPAIALALLSAQASVADVTLKVGDAAPAIKVAKFVKGEAVQKFEPGKVYVMEFWATWCGPCRAAIPHVTEIQAKFKDSVVVIGTNVWERDEALVQPFLKDMGDKMNYRVAMDDKSSDEKGAMATTWLDAAGQDGIPCSIIVDKAGKIAWIGHPMTMETPLSQIVAGTFDAAAEAAKAEKLTSIQKRFGDAMRAGDTDGAIKVLDEAAGTSDEMAKTVLGTKFQVLLRADRYDEAYAMGDKLYDVLKESADELNALAWTIATAPTVKKRDLPLAEKLAARAVELTKSENGATLDTLARVYFDQGKVDKAIETEEKAVAKADASDKAELEASLKKYKSASK